MRLTLRSRFDSYWMPEPNSGCWLWLGTYYDSGYARFWDGKRSRRASRVAWLVYRGEEIPEHLLACHDCDNPACVNHNHLFVGTSKDNTQDAIKKGKIIGGAHAFLKGERNPSVKLTEAQVLEILALRRQGVKAKDIAPDYGVGLQIIYNITNGTNWRHLHAPHSS